MNELNERMSCVDEVPFRGDWGEVERRAASPQPMRDPAGGRALRTIALLAAALLVLGAALYGLKDLRGGPQAATVGAGEIVRYDLGSPPQPISVGDGAAWVKIGAGTGTPSDLVRIDAATGQQQTLDTPGGDWTAVGGGSTWLLCNSAACGGGSVVRLDPATGEVLGTTRLPARGGQIVGTPAGAWITTEQGMSFLDADGNLTKSFSINQTNLVGADDDTLWVSAPGAVRSIDPETGAVLATVDFSDVCTMEVAAGTVWIASCQGQGDRLMGIDAHSAEVLFDKPIEGHGQMRYADGVLWLGQRDPTNQDQLRVVSFDPRTGAPFGSPMVIPSDPTGEQFRLRSIFPPHVFFAVGEDSLWLTDFGAGEVIRVGIPAQEGPPVGQTPSSEPVADVHLGEMTQLDLSLDEGSVSSMAEGFGSAWVIAQFEQPGVNQLRRFDPKSGSVEATFQLPVAGGSEWGGDGLVIGDGYVWTSAWNSATIFRIDPADNAVTQFSLDGRVVSQVAVDQVTGELWVTVAGNGDDGSTLLNLDPNDGSVLSSTTYTTDYGGELLPLQGTVWQQSRQVRHSTVYGGFLQQILPGTALDVRTGGSFAFPTTDGRSIWSPASGNNDVMNLASGIVQVDASGQVLQTWDVGSVDYDVAVGEDGGVWFLGAKGLERLNPTTGDVQSWRSSPDGETPILIVVGSKGVWVGTYEGHLFFRPFV